MSEEQVDYVDYVDFNEVPDLNLTASPSSKSPRIGKSPKIRRHKSEASVYFEKLLPKLNEEKDPEEAANNNNTNGGPSSPINISAFSKDPKQFAFELERMIESIRNQKELPPKSIIIALLNVLDYWIENHGIKSINSLEEYIYKYESMKSENNKQQIILKHKIDEYKNDRDEYQKRRLSFSGHTNEYTTELSQQLNEYEQQLQTASFLKTQILNLEKELEDKSGENEKNLAQRTHQQKEINRLRSDKLQLEKLIDSQKSQLSAMNSMDNELKIKTNEIKEIKKKYKLIENELLQIRIEKEELYSEKKEMQNKLCDYGKLKANLNEYTKTINTLNQTNIKLNNTINELQNELLNINNKINQIKINNNHMTFINFTNETKTYNAPKFDDELKNDLEEFEISIGNDVCMDDMTDVNKKDNNDDNDSVVFSYRNMYKSFSIVGVSCLCYFMYTQSYHGNAWPKAKQKKKN